MRFPTSERCLHLISQPNLYYSLPKNLSALSFSHVTSHQRSASTLSAIHDSLRKAQRTEGALDGRGGRGRLPPAKSAELVARRKARLAAEADAPDFKIRRGKKDITERAFPKPLSRQARFNDPDHRIGRKSHVFQLKTGQQDSGLDRGSRGEGTRRYEGSDGRNRRDAWDGRSSASPEGDRHDRPPPQQSTFESQFAKAFREPRDERRSHTRSDRRQTRPRDAEPRRPRGGDTRPRSFEARSQFGDRPRRAGSHARSPSGDRPRRAGSDSQPQFGDRKQFGDRPRRAGADARDSRSTRAQEDNTAEGRDQEDSQGRKKRTGPVSIPYTTAASQFLYGTSAVESALTVTRRKLYKLYIYRGANRQKTLKDEAIEKLARKKGLKPFIVDEKGQRMMERMSLGRPHNGYVLEASPLPVLPLDGLGSVSDASEAANPGFKVQIGHQSTEQADINGISDFVPTKAGVHRPLVLLLDQVLDPGNLGAVLRTARFFGVDAVAITQRSSATLSAVAVKASAGACEEMTLFSVDSAADFLDRSKEAGWRVFAAMPPSKRGHGRRPVMDVFEIEAADPLATTPSILVLGSEGEGLSRALKSRADVEVNVPSCTDGASLVDSLNVSVAAALLSSAFVRKRVQADKFNAIQAEKAKDELGLFDHGGPMMAWDSKESHQDSYEDSHNEVASDSGAMF